MVRSLLFLNCIVFKHVLGAQGFTNLEGEKRMFLQKVEVPASNYILLTSLALNTT